MEGLLQFGALLVSIIGVFVTLFLMLLKINRNSVTKEDLNNSIGVLRLEINKRFEEVDRRFEEAAADREKIRMEMKVGFAEAAADREKIRMEMKEGLTAASVERKRIEEQAREDRKEIKGEIKRQNQNYIEHLAHHASPRANPVNET